MDTTFQLVSHFGLSLLGFITGLVLLRFHTWPSFLGGELQFVHSLSVRIGCPSSLTHRAFLSSPCVPCFLLLPGFRHIFQENAKKNPKRQRDSSRIGCVNARSIPFSRAHQIRQQIQVTFYHSFFDTHSGFCFGFELLFWFAKDLGFEICGLMIVMWAPCICEASSEINRSWVCEEDTRLSSSCHFSLLMTVSFL